MAKAMTKVDGMLKLKDIQILWPNFSGEERGKFNPEGKRNFCALFDLSNPEHRDIIEMLKTDGWNVKERPPRDGEGEPDVYIQVNVNFGGYKPPKVYMVTSKGAKVKLDEETVGQLDEVDIEKANIAVNPYEWEFNGRHGISGYLDTGYFEMSPDPFGDLYDDEPAPAPDADDDIPF